MANIDDPKHAHHMPALTAGTVLDPKDPAFHKAVDLVKKGHFTFKVVGDAVRTTNDDGTVTDTAPIARTYNPNPK